jgi:hypothetical protein
LVGHGAELNETNLEGASDGRVSRVANSSDGRETRVDKTGVNRGGTKDGRFWEGNVLRCDRGAFLEKPRSDLLDLSEDHVSWLFQSLVRSSDEAHKGLVERS